jgi:hypothetical protein
MLIIYVDTFRLLRKIYKAVPWQSGQYVRRDSAECLRILKPRGKTGDICNMKTNFFER